MVRVRVRFDSALFIDFQNPQRNRYRPPFARRVLAEFQSRKAHCVHIRDRDLIKYLSALVLAVVCYMSAWSAITTEHARDGRSLVVMGTAPGRLSYRTCRSHWWEYVTEMGERRGGVGGGGGEVQLHFLYLCQRLSGYERTGNHTSL